MKKLAISAVLILVLGTAATAMQGAQGKTFMGAVSSVDIEAKLLTVRDTAAGANEGKTMSFKVDTQTKIEKASQSAMGKPESEAGSKSSLGLGDIKVGDHVNVTYAESGGDNLARTIAIQAKPTT
ncbi:MAG: hypothetical protein ACRD1X_02530 [Vicinamibacteria bacterium]